jgi:Holliday junction resolvasome RuvABC DNA-binding subunit
MKILWTNFRFWWTYHELCQSLNKKNFSRVEELIIIRKKMAEVLRNNIKDKNKNKEDKNKWKFEWINSTEISWKIVFLIF